MINSTGTVGNVGLDGAHRQPSGTFMNIPYFDCDPETFNTCHKGRLKGKHWKSFMKNDPLSTDIKMWLKKNKNSSFLLRNQDNNTFVFAHKGIV